MAYEKELKIAKEVALKAGEIMLEYFEGNQQLRHKDDGTPLTIADTKINSMVIEELIKHFDYGIIGEEESTSEYGGGYKWLCDPIDGTLAFAVGSPTATFSLGLVKDGIPILGVVYDPFLNKLYWGIKKHGSFCNGNKLKVSDSPLKGHYVEVTSSAKQHARNPELIENLVKAGAKPDTIYGAVYKSCLVARGRVIGFLEKSVNPHDMAAVHVIVEEAGGKVTGYDGKPLDYSKPFKGAIASNKVVHADILKCIP